MAKAGLLTSRAPTAEEQQDLADGRESGRCLAGYDIGQTVVVAGQACVAVEAMKVPTPPSNVPAAYPGFWRPMGSLLHQGPLSDRRLSVVKVAKPKQDLRFDVPVIGSRSIEVMRLAGATGLRSRLVEPWYSTWRYRSIWPRQGASRSSRFSLARLDTGVRKRSNQLGLNEQFVEIPVKLTKSSLRRRPAGPGSRRCLKHPRTRGPYCPAASRPGGPQLYPPLAGRFQDESRHSFRGSGLRLSSTPRT